MAEPGPLAWTDELVTRFWSYYAERRAEDYFTRKFGQRILQVTEPFFTREAVVCDFGCGAGYLIEKLLPRYRAGGYDSTPANVEAARGRLGRHPNLVGVFGLDETPTPRQYDVVYCVETLEHLLESQVAPTLDRLRTLLKDGGRVIVTTPHAEDLDASTVFCPCCRHSFHRWQHLRSFDAESLTRFMARGGFRPTAVFTTDFSCGTRLGRLRLRLRTALGRKHPHLVWIGGKGPEVDVSNVEHAARLNRLLPEGRRVTLAGDRLVFGGAQVPITRGVSRFRNEDGYNASFALQWKRFRLDQYDHVNGTSLTRDRYRANTGWPSDGLEGEQVLEAGCGAGRFTRILAETGASVVAIDYSSAVDVCAEVNGGFENVLCLQADILDMPFADGCFDRVFCHGVLQHTADPSRAFGALHRVLRPGGLMSIDVYLKDGKIRPWKSKYLWRPLTTRMAPDRLLRLLGWFIPRWLPVDTAIKSVPGLGNYLGALVPCWNYHWTPLSPERRRQWAIMDTFDALAPKYDNPVTLDEVRGWFRSRGYSEYEVREGGNGVLGNGRKPVD